MAMVERGEPQEVLRRFGGGDGTLAEPNQGSHVVTQVGKGEVVNLDVLSQDILMGNETG
jgi:hypothetical protein